MDTKGGNPYWPWLAFSLEEALRGGLTEPAELLSFATPDVLVAQLPHALTTSILEAALSTGVLTPDSILQTATPALLAEHLPPDVIWRCLTQAASRAHLDERGATAGEPAKKWLAAILDRALSEGLVTPADVVRFVPPAEFVKDAPLAVVAELIRAGLTSGHLDAQLVLAHLTPQVIAHHLPPALGWSCIADAAHRHLGVAAGKAQPAAPPPSPEAKKPAATPPRREASGGKGRSGLDAPIEPTLKRSAKRSSELLEDWSEPSTDVGALEVLDEQPLPPPPAVRQR